MTPIRSTWTGDLVIGAVAIGIRVHTAVEDSPGPRMHDAHAACGGRTGLHRYCKGCGQEDLAAWEVGKVVEVDGQAATLDWHDLEALNPRIAHEATVIEFVEPHTIPVELYGSTYYLSPDKPKGKASRNRADRPYTDGKAYAVLAEGLRRAGRVAVVRIALRQREALGFVYAQEGMLCLRTLLWAEQVRQPDIDNLPVAQDFTDRELAVTEALISALSGKFDPTAPGYANSYVDRLTTLVQERVAA